MILPPVVCWHWSAGQRSQACSPSQSTAEISCREAGHYQASREAGDEASPDHGDSRDRSTAEPIFRGQPRMCWFRRAFAIALDCAATRAGDSAGQTVRVCRMGSPTCLCNAARNAAMHALFELAVVRRRA
jgi:hypothetical protein